ncbi:MAG TPA: universal stress protein [Bryobacteraceae bacterium]
MPIAGTWAEHIRMQLTHVLFPFDYSDRCRRTAPFVNGLIEKAGAHLTILNVIEDPVARYPAGAAFRLPKSVQDEILASSTKFLREYTNETFPSFDVDAVCRMGDPAKEIIRTANEIHAGLIIMPTRGCGPFRALLLGSVTAKVLDDAKCPVWTDAHMDQCDRPACAQIRSILCALDEEEDRVWVLRKASDVANLYSAALHLVRVVPEVRVSSDALTAGWENASKETARLEMSELREEAGASADICVEAGSVSAAVRRAALAHNADLVIIGRGRLDGFLGRLRTNAYAIIRDSPCPVLSI